MPDDLFDPYAGVPTNPKYSQFQALALANTGVGRINEANLMAEALGPQTSSGAFGALSPEALFGLPADHVSDVAKTRSAQALNQILTNMHALDFARKATGQDQADAIEQETIKQAGAKDIAAMNADERLLAAEKTRKDTKGFNRETMDHVKFEANKAFDAWLQDPAKSPKPTKNQILMTEYGKRLQEARAFKSALGTKAEMLKQGNMSPEVVNLLTGLGMTGKQAIVELGLADEADRVFEDTKPIKKEVSTIPVGYIHTTPAGKMKFKGGDSKDIKNWEKVKEK